MFTLGDMMIPRKFTKIRNSQIWAFSTLMLNLLNMAEEKLLTERYLPALILIIAC